MASFKPAGVAEHMRMNATEAEPGPSLADRIRAALAGGMSVRKTAAKFEVNASTVQRIGRPFGGAEDAGVAA